MKHAFWVSLLLLAVPVWADDIIICDPTDAIVPNRVSSYQRNVDPFKSGATTNPNSLIYSLPASTVHPWNGVVPNAAQVHWKCSGSTVVEMSTAEKNALTSAAATAANTALRTGSKAQFDGQTETGQGLRCLAKVLLDEINTLRTRTNDIKNCVATASTLAVAKTCEANLTNLSDRTLAQAKTAIGTCVDSGVVDE